MANRFERSIVIEAPAVDVFDYVADLTRHGEWSTNPLAVTLEHDGPIAVGTTFHSEATLLGTQRDLGRVTVFDRPVRFEFVTEGKAGTVRNWFTFTDDGSSCRLAKGSHNTRLSWFSKLMIPVLAVIVPSMYDRNLHAIKAAVEHAGSAAGVA